MTDSSAAGFRSTKVYDVLIAAPLILFYGFSLAGLGPQFAVALRLKPFWVSALQLLSLASFAFYLALIIALIFVRRLPVAKSKTIWPRALAILGSTALFLLPLLRPAMLSPPMVAISAVLAGGGTIAELWILIWLRHAFSLMPEARALLTRGPYHRIRHPLYLAGLITSLGAMLHFEQPWAGIVILVNFAFQLLRMHFEEQVLTSAFPEYADYAAQTSRLIPGIY
jgi:protein-S-isoprenylcysteine O-methyltransferase Ste14